MRGLHPLTAKMLAAYPGEFLLTRCDTCLGPDIATHTEVATNSSVTCQYCEDAMEAEYAAQGGE